MSHVCFEVVGHPAPQGSKKGWVNKKTGKVQMVESSTAVKPWRQDVLQTALSLNLPRPLDGALGGLIVFRFQRPKSHFGTGRNAGVLKPTAPVFVTSHALGDGDKLQRSTFDALKDAGVIVDDSLIADLRFKKVYANAGDRTGATISLEEMSNTVG